MSVACINEFREFAYRRLPPMFFQYLDGGSYDEITLRRNVSDLQSIALRQRVMRDVSKLSTKVTWFGQDYAMPVGLGPVGFAGMFARRGEVQAARAAAKAHVPLCLSTLSICGVQEVASASTQPIWYQVYMIKDRGFMSTLLERVAAAGCTALVFTVDLPVIGSRWRDYRAGMSAPPGLVSELRRVWQGLTHPAWLWDVHFNGRPHFFGNLAGAVKDAKGFGQLTPWIASNFDPTLTWKDIAWVRERWKGPIIVKGLLDPDDARAAIDTGIDGVVVSNHGGRQLDGAPSSAAALPRVVEAIDGRATVLMDGGVRTGLDVLRALALGAQGCLLGRGWAYALAARGEAGVTRALDIIRSELAVAMALTGCIDVRDAGRELLA